MFRNAVKLFKIRGFDIKLDPSWLIIATLITWSLSQHYFPQTLTEGSDGLFLIMGLTTMILFFASLLLHELAHSVVARGLGMEIGGITLFLFGGVAELRAEPPSAEVEFWVALAGPVMSLCLALGFWALSWITSLTGNLDAATVVMSYLATINLVLALFNLVPAFPLDGGRVLRAYLWHRSGDVLYATRIAATSGAVFAYLLMGLGLFALFQGYLVSALWQVMIGGFLLMAARASYQQQLSHAVFEGRTVADIMRHDPVSVGPEMTLSELVDTILLRHGITYAPVLEGNVLLGHIDQKMVTGIDREHWSSTRVGDVFAGLEEASTVLPDLPIQSLLDRISTTGQRKFLVVKGSRLLGIVTLSDLSRHLQLSDLAVAR